VYAKEPWRIPMLTGGVMNDLDVEALRLRLCASDLVRARSTIDHADDVPPNLDYVVRRIVERTMVASVPPVARPPSRIYHTDECPVCTGTDGWGSSRAVTSSVARATPRSACTHPPAPVHSAARPLDDCGNN